jgi:hypothetical protein
MMPSTHHRVDCIGWRVPEFTGVSHVELTVRDVDRSSAGISRFSGFVKVAENAEDEHSTPGVMAQVVNLMHRASGLTIGLVRHASGTHDEFSELRVGLDISRCLSRPARTWRAGSSTWTPVECCTPASPRVHGNR